jgi:hypothetical protein
MDGKAEGRVSGSEGVNLFRNGAVGFIDWLDVWRSTTDTLSDRVENGLVHLCICERSDGICKSGIRLPFASLPPSRRMLLREMRLEVAQARKAMLANALSQRVRTQD